MAYSTRKPLHTTTLTGRKFAVWPTAVQALLVNDAAEVLLLSSPTRNRVGEWQVVSGGLDADETILDGATREAYEEAGAEIVIRPLGIVHAQTFKYDDNIPFMLSVHYLFHYLGGQVVPGDDMTGSLVRWWSLEALAASDITYHPSTSLWHLERAVQLWRLWHKEPPPLEQLQSSKLI